MSTMVSASARIGNHSLRAAGWPGDPVRAARRFHAPEPEHQRQQPSLEEQQRAVAGAGEALPASHVAPGERDGREDEHHDGRRREA